MELSNTAYVILGALHERPRSGYDIKAFADHSTRHFWAVSYASSTQSSSGSSMRD